MTQADYSKVMPIGWVCFWVGVAIMLLIPSLILFSGPFFLAAFILSIVGITQSRVTSGVVLLLATLIVPPAITIGTYALIAYKDTVEEREAEEFVKYWQEEARKQQNEKIEKKIEERKEVLKNISFESVTAEFGRYSMVIKGTVRNNDVRKVEDVKVGVEWMDKNGKVVDTDWAYAAGYEGINPGGKKSFSISTPLDKKAERFRHYIIED